jgi:hypothetical protein
MTVKLALLCSTVVLDSLLLRSKMKCLQRNLFQSRRDTHHAVQYTVQEQSERRRMLGLVLHNSVHDLGHLRGATITRGRPRTPRG